MATQVSTGQLILHRRTCQKTRIGVRLDLDNVCICSHKLRFHVDHEIIGIVKYCVGDDICVCQDFKLDNLSYIEDLAEERGLV